MTMPVLSVHYTNWLILFAFLVLGVLREALPYLWAKRQEQKKTYRESLLLEEPVLYYGMDSKGPVTVVESFSSPTASNADHQETETQQKKS